ncbi:MAG TPA: hypothetical protein VIL78_03750, partial [Hanamia sp.]
MRKIYSQILLLNSFISAIYASKILRRTITAISIVIFMLPVKSYAQVIITSPSLTVTTCGNFPTAYFTLSDIIIKETSSGDFSPATNLTLVLSVPANFEFQPGIGIVSYAASANISSAAISVTASTITITYSSNTNTNKIDALTISGISIRGINGVASNQSITRGGTSTGVI